jgi:hypothetical protein
MVTQVYNWNYWCQNFIREARNGSSGDDAPRVATGTMFMPGGTATAAGPAARCTDLLDCYARGS